MDQPLRLRAQFVGSPERHQPAAVQKRHAVAAVGIVHVGCRKHDRRSLAAEVVEDLPKLPARERIDPEPGLVEKQ